jgi:hypothetical protein
MVEWYHKLMRRVIMTKYDVKVQGKDVMYTEYFRIFSTSKVEAMKKGIRMARLCDNVKGEIHATARIIREETFTPGICV